ncbi:hypothetical protein ES703_90141 [subsurface metagenome]
MAGKGHALARDELIRVLTVFQGVTTGLGAADGSTLVDSALIGVNDYITNKTILIMSGDAINETRQATVFAPATGTITVDPPFNNQIAVGTLFRIINLSAGSSLAIIIAILTASFDLINAMLVLTETGGTVTASGIGTPDNVYVNDAPAGVFDPQKVMIDFSDLDVGEVATVRTYYRIKSGGDLKLKDELEFAGVQDRPLINIELEPNRFGIEVTIEATAAVVFDWEVLYKA